MPPHSKTAQSVRRTLTIMRQLIEQPRGLFLREVVDQVNLPAPTVHRLLASLVSEGFVRQDRTRHRYLIDSYFWRLLDQSWNAELKRFEPMRSVIEAVRDRLEHTVHLAIWDEPRSDVRTLLRADGTRLLRVVSNVEDDLAYCTATGRVLLAARDREEIQEYFQTHTLAQRTPYTVVDARLVERLLEQVRVQGWGTEANEFYNGVTCVGVPVTSSRLGVTIAALSVSIPSGEASGLIGVALPILQEAAVAIGRTYDGQNPERNTEVVAEYDE